MSGEVVEWGVWHSQGIRREASERAARESLEWMVREWDAKRRSVKGRRPVIVTRTVTPWEPIEADQ